MPAALGQQNPQTLNGMISLRQPAPQSLIDPLYVVLPEWNPNIYFEVLDWPACHGTELPPAGNECLLQYDDQDNLRCTWWQGTTDFSDLELGAFGGDVSGVASSANVDTVLGGKTPLVTTSALGGDLAGTHGAAEVETVLNGLVPLISGHPTASDAGVSWGVVLTGSGGAYVSGSGDWTCDAYSPGSRITFNETRSVGRMVAVGCSVNLNAEPGSLVAAFNIANAQQIVAYAYNGTSLATGVPVAFAVFG
jgi:hypothetical protein